jgi:hypothetical protein
MGRYYAGRETRQTWGSQQVSGGACVYLFAVCSASREATPPWTILPPGSVGFEAETDAEGLRVSASSAGG